MTMFPDFSKATQKPNIDRDSGENEQRDQSNVHVIDMGMLTDPIKKELAQC